MSTTTESLQKFDDMLKKAYEEVPDDKKNNFFPEQNRSKKIIEYFNKQPALLLTCISSLAAIFVFLSKGVDYAANYKYCRYWNIDSKLIMGDSSASVLYLLARYFIFCLLSLSISIFLQKRLYSFELIRSCKKLLIIKNNCEKILSDKLRKISREALQEHINDKADDSVIQKDIQKIHERIIEIDSENRELEHAFLKEIIK